MKKIILIILAVMISGCATLFNSKEDVVNFNSNPAGGTVYINGNYMGKTPVSLQLPVKESKTVTFRASGYEDKTYYLNSNVGVGWVILDVLSGFYPVIIDAITGSWNELDTKSINVLFEPKE